MLHDALVISLSRNFWDDVWRSRHQVMSRLARRNTVLFGSRPMTLDEAWPWAPVRSPLRRPGTHEITPNLYAYVPPRWLPTMFRAPALEGTLEGWRRAHLRRTVQRWPDRPRVLYLWHPMYARYIDAFPGSVVCYHLFDDLTAYGRAGDRPADGALERIFARADLVFVASEELVERYRRFGNVHWLPNGVDYDAYAAAPGATTAPADLAAISRPRIGYAGTLRDQIDVPLLTRIAAARREWSLVLVGDVSRGMAASPEYRELAAQPNVHLLGQKTREEMPAYLSHLDAGLLPYRLDGAARFCYPLKMHEYLAAGLPVVSSALVAVEQFTSVIRVADGVEAWVATLQRCLAHDEPDAMAERRRVAAGNSWDRRVDTISQLIAAAARSGGHR